jgi:type IV pilus assembly protein PilP
MRSFMPILSRSFVFTIAVLTLSACSPTEEPQQWVAREKAKRGAPLAPLPVIKTFETFVYKDQDNRDPFDLSAQEQEQTTNTGPHPDQNRAREPLESFPLDGLKMAGTLGLAKSIEGLVRDPDGVVHRVHVGNYLGQNFGKITAVGEDRIDMVELVPNGGGGWMERPASIALGDTKQ